MSVFGVITSILFQVSLSFTFNHWKKSNGAADDSEPLMSANQDEAIKTDKKNFFKTLEFYQVGFLFIVARFFTLMTMVYTTVWLNARANDASTVNENHIQNIVLVPMTAFIASFVASIALRQIFRFVGYRVCYLIGCLIGISGCIWVAVDRKVTVPELYLIAICYGSCHSTLMITSLSMTAEMIGKHVEQSGKIYSVTLFISKLSTGLAFFGFSMM